MQTSPSNRTIHHSSSLGGTLVILAMALTAAASPATAQTIPYGQEISLQSDHGRFLVAEPNGRLDANREDQGAWERFRLDAVEATGNQLRFGDRVALHSAHGKFVVAEPDGSAGADRSQRGPWETWTVVNPFDPGSTALVRVRDAVSLRSDHATHLVAEPDGRANADRPQIGPWETWRIGREWTDFYYDEASSTACTPGQCCPCPYRGRFDGANCFVARPPVGSQALLSEREFFYDVPESGRCPLGTLGDGRCQVGTNPAAPPPFLFENGFYVSSLCSPDGELNVRVERVAHCGFPLFCGHRLTREEFRPWPDSGVPRPIQRNTQIGVVFGPGEAPARRVGLLLAGQQFDQPIETGSGNQVTGQPSGFKEGWSFREPRRGFTLDDGSVAHRLIQEEFFDPEDSFLAVAFDARFNHKFNRDNKERIEDAYYRWLQSKFDPRNVELVYLAGHSRGGCLAMRLAQRIQEEMPYVPVVAQSFDGVCNRNQGELGVRFPGRVNNPLASGGGAFAWPTDLRQEFQNQESSLALFQLVGGHRFLFGDLAVRAFSQHRADEEDLDLCWYRQRWVDLSHGQLGGFRIVQPALDHLRASLDRFASSATCPSVGECVKATVLPPFECNDLFPDDCEEQTECTLNTRCRRVSGSLTCRDLSNEAECGRYGRWCSWRSGRNRCVRRFNPGAGPFECNDLLPGDCGNHTECALRQECRRESGSLTCGDLFTEELCERYSTFGCEWR